MIPDINLLTSHVQVADVLTSSKNKAVNSVVSLIAKVAITGLAGALVGAITTAFFATTLPISLGAGLGAGGLLVIAAVAYVIYKLAMNIIGPSREREIQLTDIPEEVALELNSSDDEHLEY